MREIISLCVGQAGIQVGSACQELYCLEHGIDSDGQMPTDITLGGGDDAFNTFFRETYTGKHVPRTVFADLEPSAVDEIRTGTYHQLYHSEQLVSGEDNAAGGNFAHGHYSSASQPFADIVLDRMRKQAEICTNLQGFMIFNAVGGGTGSGLGSLLLERLAAEYGKKTKLACVVYPSPKVSSIDVEPYNSVLSLKSLMGHIDAAIMLDNDAMYDACSLGIARPTYANLNGVAARLISSVTASIRFDGTLNQSLDELRTNLVPYPRLHFLVSSYSPVSSVSSFKQPSAAEMTSALFEPASMLVKCAPLNGKFLAGCLMYHGDVDPGDVIAAVASVNAKSTVKFVDWCPTGFMGGINFDLPAIAPGSGLADTKCAACMVSNSTAVASVFSSLASKFDLMYAKRASVQQYVREGMEESEFVAAREDLAALLNDYKMVSA